MSNYNVGLVGYGWAATAHIAAINATRQGRVTAVCSSRPLDAAELSAKYGTPIRVYRDLDAMLADPGVDIVDVTGLPSRHRDHAVAAAKAGKNFILEKPMANTPAEVADIVAAAAQAGVKGCVCFEARFSSQFLATKAVIDEGLPGYLHSDEVDDDHGIALERRSPTADIPGLAPGASRAARPPPSPAPARPRPDCASCPRPRTGIPRKRSL